MVIEERLLTPGKDVDVEAALDAYVRDIPRSLPESFHDLTKLAADRSLEVMYPLLLQAARETRSGFVSMDDGWHYGFQDSGNPWRPCLLVAKPDGAGYLCAFELDVKPSREALAAFDPTLPTDVGTRINFDLISARFDVEKRLINQGILAGMPEPDSVTQIRHAGIHLIRPTPSPLMEVGNLFPGTLEETLANVAAGSYSGGLVITFKPDGPRFKASGGQCFLTSGAYEALARLGGVARQAAGLEAVAARNDEVGSRSVMTLCDRPWEISILEAAVGAIYRDGGIPGQGTQDATSRVWLHGVTMAIPRMAADLEEARGFLNGRHSTSDASYDCNDGRSRMWVVDGPDGDKDAYMRSQAGMYLARRQEGIDGTMLTLARIGARNLETDLAPTVVDMSHGGSGFLGRYRVDADGTATIVEPPTLSDDAILAMGDVTNMASSIAACAEDDYGFESPVP